MPDEVSTGIYRLPIPIPDSPLGDVNAYAIRVPEGLCQVDCGWDTPVAYDTLQRHLSDIGCTVRDIREIVVTHIHPDHFGLAGHLAAESGATVSMHRLEAAYVGARYGDVRALLDDMHAWLRLHGVEGAELEAMTEGSLQMIERVGTRRPDVLLEGGERLHWGDYDFEILWTPGHSAGLICLHDAERRLLLSSDHVLQRISPHVGLHTQSSGDPLADFITSLRRVRDLPVDVVLPGHGKPFAGLASRVDELIAHHEQRLQAIETLLEDGEQTAYQLAGRLSWRGSESGWERLRPFQRRMALTETIAHLEYLVGVQRIQKQTVGARVQYSLSGRARTT